MLVTMHSDANYFLKGHALKAAYTIDLCPRACSGHGKCMPDSVCACDAGFGGEDCATELCPNKCTNGVCITGAAGAQLFCECKIGFAGKDCNTTLETDSWNTINQPPPSVSGLSKRAGHATMYSAAKDEMWVFGGTVLSRFLADVQHYSFTGTWTTVHEGGASSVYGVDCPEPRYLQSGVLYEKGTTRSLLVYGGSTSEGVYNADLWQFDIAAAAWTKLAPTNAPGDINVPPGIMGHTATMVDDDMYVFGGLSVHGLHAGLYRYNVPSNTWTELDLSPSDTARPDGVWGHSAVFDPDLRQIIIFGGRRNVRYIPDPDYHYEVFRSGLLHAYAVDESKWYTMLPKTRCTKPDCMARSSHSAVLVKDNTERPWGNSKTYMVVFGGCPFTHADGNFQNGMNTNCYSDEMLILDLTCGATHGWVTHAGHPSAKLPVGGIPAPRSFHSAVYRAKTQTMVVVAGLDGAPLDDMHSYALPTNMAFCDRYDASQPCEEVRLHRLPTTPDESLFCQP